MFIKCWECFIEGESRNFVSLERKVRERRFGNLVNKREGECLLRYGKDNF